MHLTPGEMLGYLKSRGCRIGGITLGERGLVWYDEDGREGVLPALAVPPERVIDTNGAGDIFHGAYVYSAMAHPDLLWRQHFVFARAASAYAIQHLGNEQSLPTLADIAAVQAAYPERAPAEPALA
jgi:sugar/nucleoside kinase (ribokinase family)